MDVLDVLAQPLTLEWVSTLLKQLMDHGLLVRSFGKPKAYHGLAYFYTLSALGKAVMACEMDDA
jgi:hypothetical protein